MAKFAAIKRPNAPMMDKIQPTDITFLEPNLSPKEPAGILSTTATSIGAIKRAENSAVVICN